ncbi:MAG: zf-HC2 domain-containing protein [Gammaproteobacteria bacterium]|nr:zf-HC2 domain-containing protein [Gammaproteobacteria bacterium]
MNCEQCSNLLNDYLDGTLSDEFEEQFQKHLEQCAHCRASYNGSFILNKALKTFPVPEPDEQFEQRMFDGLEQVDVQSGPHWITALISGAIAASIMMWFVFISGTLSTDIGLDQVIVSLPFQQRKDVQLVFNSPIDIKGAHFTITLPTNVEVYGRPGVHELSWQAQLQSGNNLLTLPLISKGNVDGELVARLNSGDNSKVFIIKLNSSPDTTIITLNHNNKTV